MTGSRILMLPDAISIFRRRGFAAVGELAVFHACEQVEVFFDAAVAVRAVFTRFGQRAAVFAHFFGR